MFNDLQWTLWAQLGNLDFSDDLGFLSRSYAHIQDKATRSVSPSTDTGLSLRMQHFSNYPVTAEGQPLEQVDVCTCLVNKVDAQGGTDADVRASTGNAKIFLIL